VIATVLLQTRAFTASQVFSARKVEGQKNEDAWQRSKKGVAALSDGASVSFDSANWSRILVRRYAQFPQFDRAWLTNAIADFVKLYDRENLPWMQQAAFDQGSFASLLGMTHYGQGLVHVLAIGDSIALLCDDNRIVGSFPYDSPEQFDERPQLLSTNPAENAFLDDRDFMIDRSVDWNLGKFDRPALLCMTDALGQWALAHRDEEPSPIGTLRGIQSSVAFNRFVREERARGRMRRDDTTFLAYWDW